MKDIFKFIDEQVKQGYDLMGDRRPLATLICEKYNYTNRTTVLNYISIYCRENNYPKKHDIAKDKTSGLKLASKIKKKLYLGQEVKVLLQNERKNKFSNYKGRIIQITSKLIAVALDAGYNITVNINELVNPYSIAIKVKTDKEYKDFNLKGYNVKSEFDLRSLIV